MPWKALSNLDGKLWVSYGALSIFDGKLWVSYRAVALVLFVSRECLVLCRVMSSGGKCVSDGLCFSSGDIEYIFLRTMGNACNDIPSDGNNDIPSVLDNDIPSDAVLPKKLWVGWVGNKFMPTSTLLSIFRAGIHMMRSEAKISLCTVVSARNETQIINQM